MGERAEKKTGAAGQRDAKGRFAEGNPGGPGRAPGSPNKTTATMRELVERSIHERHPGGVMAWLNGLPDELFVRLADKLLPRQSQVELSGSAPALALQVNIVPLTEQRASIEAAPIDALPLPAPALPQAQEAAHDDAAPPDPDR